MSAKLLLKVDKCCRGPRANRFDRRASPVICGRRSNFAQDPAKDVDKTKDKAAKFRQNLEKSLKRQIVGTFNLSADCGSAIPPPMQLKSAKIA
jgi:hypothetical protein